MTPPVESIKIWVIHGPNLNLLGTREPEIYGRTRLSQIDSELKKLGNQWGLEVVTFQSNHEGVIVETIQSAIDQAAGIVINPAAYTHTSIAIRDALAMLDMPIIEIHLSNVHKREPFRRQSLISDICTGQIVGLGVNGYYLALRAMADIIGAALPSQ